MTRLNGRWALRYIISKKLQNKKKKKQAGDTTGSYHADFSCKFGVHLAIASYWRGRIDGLKSLLEKNVVLMAG